jgi:hypothetical protein
MWKHIVSKRLSSKYQPCCTARADCAIHQSRGPFSFQTGHNDIFSDGVLELPSGLLRPALCVNACLLLRCLIT